MLSVEQRNLFLIKNINHSQAPEATQPRTMKNGRNTMQTYRKTLIVHFLVEQSLHFSFHSEGSRVGFFFSFFPLFLFCSFVFYLQSVDDHPSLNTARNRWKGPLICSFSVYNRHNRFKMPARRDQTAPFWPVRTVDERRKKTTHCSIMNHIPGEGWWNRRLVCLQHQHQ